MHLVKGSDEALVSAALSTLVHELVGKGDRSLMVEELDGEDYPASAIADAAQTPAFLTERRIVVARGLGRFAADDVVPLVNYLGDPLPTTDLVLTGGGGRLPKALTDALKKAGCSDVDTEVSSNKKERAGWFDEQFAAAGVRLDAAARSRIVGHFGENAGMLAGLLEVINSTYGGESRALTTDDIAPFLGDAGSVPPWDLTDAIDRGDVRTALAMTRRMMRSGGRHALQMMAVLHGHYARAAKLDGSGASTDRQAADLLGLKTPFQGGKALSVYRNLKHEGIVRAFDLLAQADLDLRGAKDWPDDQVLEVLVARLAKLKR